MKNLGCKLAFVIACFVSIFCGCKTIYKSGFVDVPRQPISGPIEIGPDWVEIIPPKPLVPYGTNQQILLGYHNYDLKNLSQDKTLNVLNLADGRKTIVEALIYDDEGESYALEFGAFGGFNGGVYLSRKGEIKWDGEPNFSHPDYSDVRFPIDRTYTKLKIRSEIPLKCEYVFWTGGNPK
jgi:hypothetical protein